MSTVPTLDTQLTVPDHTLVQAFDGELTILNVDTERYFSLDSVGAQVWAAIAETDTLREAHARLVQTFDAPAERLEEDLLTLVADLARAGLVVAEDP